MVFGKDTPFSVFASCIRSNNSTVKMKYRGDGGCDIVISPCTTHHTSSDSEDIWLDLPASVSQCALSTLGDGNRGHDMCLSWMECILLPLCPVPLHTVLTVSSSPLPLASSPYVSHTCIYTYYIHVLVHIYSSLHDLWVGASMNMSPAFLFLNISNMNCFSSRSI